MTLPDCILSFFPMNSNRVYLFSLLTLLLVACSAISRSPESVDIPTSSVEVLLKLKPDKAQFEVGELLALELSIANYSSTTIEITNVAWCNYVFAVAQPSSVYLLDPDGHNLLQSYHVSKLPDHDCAPITVLPGDKFFSTIALSDWLYLDKVGEHLVSVELVDTANRRWQSNQVTFEVAQVPENPVDGSAMLTIKPGQSSYSIEDLLNVRVELAVTFTNHYTETLTFLRPQGSSFSGLITPVYRFIVEDANGRQLRIIRTDGPGSEPVYNERTTFALEPGESETFYIYLRHFPEMRQSGQYNVSLVYIVRANATRLGTVTEESLNWSEDVFVGTLESNRVPLTITVDHLGAFKRALDTLVPHFDYNLDVP